MRAIRNTLMFTAVVLIQLSALSCGSGDEGTEWPFHVVADSPYLGERPPGDDPVVFAPGTVSLPGSVEMGITFSADGREIYFARSAGTTARSSWSIWTCREEEGGWTDPHKADFSRHRDFSPHMSADGRRFYFFSQNPEDPDFLEGTYVAERIGDRWGEAVFFHKGYGIVAALSGNLYSSSDHHMGSDLVVFREVGDGFSEPQDLPEGINTEGVNAHVAMAPDESYFLFDSNRDSDPPRSRIHVTFRREDGSWSEPVMLGEKINAVHSIIPAISPDGDYIFFHREGDIWWVSSAAIDRLRP